MQTSKRKIAKQDSNNQSVISAGDLVRCPECGKTWPDLAALGTVRSLNLALIATCPNCGHTWGVNHLWRPKRTVYGLSPEAKPIKTNG